MLEVLYEKETGIVRAWNADDSVQGNLLVKEGQEVVILPIDLPDFKSDIYYVDLDNQVIIGNPDYKPIPPRSTHISVIEAIDPGKARPVRVKRVWSGYEYFYDCLATESIKDQFLAGDVAVGDYVIVFFDDIGEQVVTAKVFKSW